MRQPYGIGDIHYGFVFLSRLFVLWDTVCVVKLHANNSNRSSDQQINRSSVQTTETFANILVECSLIRSNQYKLAQRGPSELSPGSTV